MAVQRRTIGRLPVARGKWNSSDTYYKYNVVSNDGSSFMSVKEDSFSGSNYEPTVELDGTNFKIYFGGTLQDGTNDVWQLMSYGRDANLSVRYVECDSASDANKTLNITGFELTTNMRYLIKMDNVNTIDNATLNISGTGAKPIMYNGSPASSTNSWIAGEVLDVYYDGTNFVAITFGGAKFMTGERLDTVGIDYEPIEDSNDLITSGAVAAALEDVAYKDGYYEQMTVGLSKNLIQPIDVDNTFLFRPTATELGLNIDIVNEVSNGLSYVKGIEGNAVAWNQSIPDNYTTPLGKKTNGIITLNGSSTGNYTLLNNESVYFVAGHRYLFISRILNNPNNLYIGNLLSWQFQYSASSISNNRYLLATAQGNFSQNIGITITKDIDYTGVQLTFDRIDLTLACPELAADANLTPAMVEKWLAKNVGIKPYYPYNAGTLLGAQYRGMTALKTANLLNPSTKTARLFEYTYGDISNKYTISNLPAGSTLYFTPDITGVESAVTMDDETHFTIPSSGILRVDTSDSVAETWLVAYWDGGMDDYSNFKPYQSNTNTIDARYIYYDDNGTKRKVWDDGVIKATGQSDTDVKDKLYIDEVEGKWKAEVNCGQKVFNGEESFSVGSFGGYPTLYQTGGIRDFLPGCAIIGSPYDKINKIISNLFTRSTCNSSDVNWVNGVKTYCYGGQYIGFRWENNDISAITSLKSWLATNYQNNTPLIMWYELATPIHHDTLYYSEDGVSFEEMNVGNFSGSIIVDNWSYEEAVVSPYENNGPTSAAPNITVEYQGDAIEAINTLHDDVAQLKEDVIDLDNEKADLDYVDENFVKQGSYSQSTRVGLADNLVGEPLDVTTSYTTKATAYDETQPELEVADGPVKMTELQGRGVAWNQLMEDSYTVSSRVKTNGVFTLNETPSGNYILLNKSAITFYANHKYIFISRILKNDNNLYIGNLLTWSGTYKSYTIGNSRYMFVSNTESFSQNIGIAVTSGVDYTGVQLTFDLIDLTLLNPTLAAKANLTVAEVEAYLATLRTPQPYYAQNAGQLLGARMLGWQLRKTPNLLNPTTKQAKLFDYAYSGHDNEYEIIGFDNLTDAALQFTPYNTGVAESVTLDSNNAFTIPSAGILEVVEAVEGTPITGDASLVCVKAVYDGTIMGEFSRFAEDDIIFDSANVYHKSGDVYSQVFDGGVMRATGDAADSVRDELGFDAVTGKCFAKVNTLDNNLGDFTYTKQGNLFTTQGLVPASSKLISGRGTALKWNQLADPIDSGIQKGITITNNGDGSINASGTANAGGNIDFTKTFNVIEEHTYFIYVPINTFNRTIACTMYGSWYGFGSATSYIGKARRSGSERLGLGSISSGAEITGKVIINIIDLTIACPELAATLTHGTADVPIVEAWFAANGLTEDYYAHDEGSLGITNAGTYQDAAAFKAAMAGVRVFSELGTPTIYTSDLYYKTGEDTYVPLEDVWPAIGQCCNWASENLVEQGDDAQGQPQSITPMTTEVFQSDLKELLKTIGDTYISKEQAKGSFNNLLTTINSNCSTVLGGTLSTSSETDASGNLQFEFTPNA